MDPTRLDALRRALAEDQTIDIVTRGARSGERRTTEIWFTRVGDEIFITGTPAGDGTPGARRKRDWLANLTAHPEFEFVLKESVHETLPAHAAVSHRSGRAHPSVHRAGDRLLPREHRVARAPRGRSPAREGHVHRGRISAQPCPVAHGLGGSSDAARRAT